MANSAIIGSLKRSFSRSPLVRGLLSKHKEIVPWATKSGAIAKRPRVLYKCFQCGLEFNSNQIQVDHIIPVIPLNIPSKYLSIDEIIDRLYCGEEGLQILCKSHHKLKSESENETRKSWLLRKKFVIYLIINRITKKRYYYVKHCVDYDEPYDGSGIDLREDIFKYGIINFSRFIVDVFDDDFKAYDLLRTLSSSSILRLESSKRPIRHINSGTIYEDNAIAAASCGMDRDRMSYHLIQSESGYADFDGECFIYDDLFNESNEYHTYKKRVLCVESNKSYGSLKDAALSVKSKTKDFDTAALKIGKAASSGGKVYGKTWKYVEDRLIIHPRLP